jgi:hypothetical protein
MTFENLGNIGELIGGIAVVVSLFYLAIQIRRNTRSTRSAAFQSLVAAANQFNITIGQDPQVAAVFRRGLQGTGALSEDEQVQFIFLLTAFFRNLENMYAHRFEVAWEAKRRSMEQMFRYPGVREWWEHHRDGFSREFQEEIDAAARSQRGASSATEEAPPPD